jgi:hypothetical protein
MVLAACGGGNSNPAVECKQAGDCDLHAGGACVVNPPTGNKWCAYPDAECISGLRWSDFGTGDGLAGTCVATPDAGPLPQTLTVVVGGNGAGTVTSEPSGIECPGTCSAQFDYGTQVKLTATASSSVFRGWSDACTGLASCQLTLDKTTNVGATFGVPGSNIWLQQTKATAFGTITSAGTFSNGDVLIGGKFQGTAMIAGSSAVSTTGVAGFFARLKADDGTVVWLNVLDNSNKITVDTATVDGSDDVIASGRFEGNATIGGSALKNLGQADIYVTKVHGSTGMPDWTVAIGGTGFDSVSGVIADANGDVLVDGDFENSIVPGTTAIMSKGARDVFVVKYSGTNGAHLWSKGLGGVATEGASASDAIAVDGSGNVVIGGTYTGTVDFGGGPRAASGSTSFIVKLAGTDGGYLVDKTITNGGGIHVAVDSSGAMYAAGSFSGTLDLGGPTSLMTSGSSDADSFIVKYSIAGAYQWANHFGNTQYDDVTNLAVDANGAFLAGLFNGTEMFGAKSLSSAGFTDIFVVHLDGSTGDALAALRLGGTNTERTDVVRTRKDRSILVAGDFVGFSEFGGVAISSNGTGDGFVVLMMPLD